MTARPQLRSGFTTVELVVAIALGTLVTVAALMLMEASQTQSRASQESGDLTLDGLRIQAALTADLERVGAGLPAAPNWAPVNMATGAAGDTLTLFFADSVSYRNSAYRCQASASDCMVLQGDAGQALAVGDLLVTGNPRSGARLLQVTAIAEPYQAKCGPDCSAEVLICLASPVADLTGAAVTGSTTYHPDGTETTSPSPCGQTFWGDGTRCEETVVQQVVGQEVGTSCSADGGAATTYTEVSFVDRTALFGYPAPPGATVHSGAGGAALVRSQRVSFARYYLDPAGDLSTLVKATALNEAGAFARAYPVVAGVTDFTISVLHDGATQYEAGPVVEAPDLARSSANPNFVEHEDASLGEGLPAFEYRRSYRTVAAVRIEFRVAADAVGSDGERATMDFSTVVALPGVLGGPSPL